MRMLLVFVALIGGMSSALAEDSAPSRIDSITKSARDMMPAMPAMPSVSLPSMPDLSLPDFSDATGRVMTEFNTFTQQVGEPTTTISRSFKPTLHHVAGAGNHAPSSIWRAINGCRRRSGRDQIYFPDQMQHYSCDVARVSGANDPSRTSATFKVPSI
jgi:hypothetical protein